MQRCGRCKEEKQEEEFSPSYRGKTGTWCRPCFAAYHRQRARGGIQPATPHQPQACMWCGETYVPKQIHGAVAMYCSKPCGTLAKNHALKVARHEVKAGRPERACLWCGTPIPVTMQANASYCSDACNSAAHNVTRKIAKRAGRKGRGENALLSRDYIATRDKYRCGICGGRVVMTKKHPDPMAPSIDHILPLALGGSNDLANLQLSHLRCNVVKRHKGGGQLRLLG